MLGLLVVVGVIVRFYTRASDRGRNRLWWVSIGIVSYVVPYILVQEVIGAWVSKALGVPSNGPEVYFVFLIASMVVGLACSVFVMRHMIRGLPVTRQSLSG